MYGGRNYVRTWRNVERRTSDTQRGRGVDSGTRQKTTIVETWNDPSIRIDEGGASDRRTDVMRGLHTCMTCDGLNRD